MPATLGVSGKVSRSALMGPHSGYPTLARDPSFGGTTMRVLIVDDHPVTRDGLRAALGTAADVEIVGEAASGEEAVEMVEASKPDVAFMDVRMPGMNGIDATKQIKEKYPDTKVIL